MTLVNSGTQVVLSQRDPLPCPTSKEEPEEAAPEPASEYATVTRRQHARQERNIEDRTRTGVRIGEVSADIGIIHMVDRR